MAEVRMERQGNGQSWVSRGSRAMVLPLALWTVVSGLGCGEKSPEHTGQAKITLAFWNAVHEPFGDEDDKRVLVQLIPLNPDPGSQAFFLRLFRKLNAARKERYEAIARMPLVGVDDDAKAYALEVVTVQQETYTLVDALCALLENPTGLPDFGQATADFVLSVLRHLGDGGNPLWDAVKEQGVEKAGAVQGARDRGRAIEREAQSLSARVDTLTTLQMEARVRLTGRYTIEFPPRIASTLKPEPLPEGAGASPRSPGEMKKDLMGREIGALGSPWLVEAIEEFQSFEVMNSLSVGRFALVKVATHVKGIHLGTEHDFKLLLVYEKGDKGWELVSTHQL